MDFNAYRAKNILDLIERWAVGKGWWTVRETGIVECPGRVDALLVPRNMDAAPMKVTRNKNGEREWFWNRPRLAAVEIKVRRADFLRGLKTGQYDRYRGSVTGLFIATPRGICKRSEIPTGIGHLQLLTVPGGEDRIVCARKPDWREVVFPENIAWRLLFKLCELHVAQVRQLEIKHREGYERVGRLLGETVFRAAMKLEEAKGA